MNLATLKTLNAELALTGQPITGPSRTASIEQAIINLETALGLSGVNSGSDLAPVALAAPAGTAITQGGTAGSTNYTYVVADVGTVGVAPATGVQTTTGNATLSTTNYNIITWASIVGHTYKIYRSASSGTPSGTGLIGTVTATGVLSTFNDTAITATGNVPTTNTTGSVSPSGPVFSGAPVFINATVPTVTSATGVTLTVAQVTNYLLIRAGSPGGGITDTTPTAAALVAAFPGIKVGNGLVFRFQNTTGQTITIAAGTGVTLAAGNTNTIVTVNTRTFLITFTNVTPGSEAVTFTSLGAGAY